MKCNRTDDLPCSRCQRALRPCHPRQALPSGELEIILKTPQSFNSANRFRSPSHRSRGRGKSYSRRETITERDASTVHLEDSLDNVNALPSIYSIAPFIAVLGDGTGVEVGDSLSVEASLSSNSPGSLDYPSSNTNLFGGEIITSSLGQGLSRKDMKQLLKMYVQWVLCRLVSLR